VIPLEEEQEEEEEEEITSKRRRIKGTTCYIVLAHLLVSRPRHRHRHQHQLIVVVLATVGSDHQQGMQIISIVLIIMTVKKMTK
jgi:hypothetical protein